MSCNLPEIHFYSIYYLSIVILLVSILVFNDGKFKFLLEKGQKYVEFSVVNVTKLDTKKIKIDKVKGI